MPSQSSAKRRRPADPLKSLARSFASIAESLREYVDLYRDSLEREAAKSRRPGIVKISRASYDRPGEEVEKQPEVPGFRRTTNPARTGPDKAQ